MKKTFQDDLTIVLGGEAGQGIQSIDSILGLLVKRSGRHYFSVSEFMSRVRGGSNSTTIRISARPISGFRQRIDILIPLHKEAIPHLKSRITTETVVIGDPEKVDYADMIDIRFAGLAESVGGVLYANTVVVGYICGLLKLDPEECVSFIDGYFEKKGADAQQHNGTAFRLGFETGKKEEGLDISIPASNTVKQNLLLSGSDVIALGALAGGCNYVCGYPMSPATSVLEKMASLSKKFDIIVEQVEDEVGVVNMALGAWYAGARALVSTSGGGFALMCEGISLAGMIESPLVLHLAQRPGPATGLPTRTEQGDLNLVLYAGHGDFPRIVLAPGSVTQGFELTRLSFELADRYQVPVFILTDQFFIDSNIDAQPFHGLDQESKSFVIQTDGKYLRFKIEKNGISPRGIPGFGDGLVCVDSDEHDESGHITENLDLRVRMTDKRLRKAETLVEAAIPPVLYGQEDYTILVVCWGSTLGTVREAVESLGQRDISVLHFPWVYPLPVETLGFLNRGTKVIDVENNTTAHFAQLVRVTTGFEIKDKILKYNGLPFDIESLASEIKRICWGEK